jgi:hypothetical protein
VGVLDVYVLCQGSPHPTVLRSSGVNTRILDPDWDTLRCDQRYPQSSYGAEPKSPTV